MTRREWAVVKARWIEEAGQEFNRDWSRDDSPKRYLPCPFCGKWYGRHYDGGHCLALTDGRNRRNLYAPLPYVKEIMVLAALTGEEMTLSFYKQQLKEIVTNGILDDVAIQAEQIAREEVENSRTESEPC